MAESIRLYFAEDGGGPLSIHSRDHDEDSAKASLFCEPTG
jgi:hypothetical protein